MNVTDLAMYLGILNSAASTVASTGGATNADGWSPLIAAAVGGVIGALATGGWRALMDRKARVRERAGLMALVSGEITINDTALGHIENPAVIATSLSTSAWDKSQSRLAQLLPTMELRRLILYYAIVEMTRADWGTIDGDLSDSHRDRIDELREMGKQAGEIAQGYVKDPDLLKPFAD